MMDDSAVQNGNGNGEQTHSNPLEANGMVLGGMKRMVTELRLLYR